MLSDFNLDIFIYELLKKDVGNIGVWYLFHKCFHTSALLIKIQSDTFVIEIGESRKLLWFTETGYKFGPFHRIILGKEKSINEFREYLKQNEIDLGENVLIEWKFWERPIIIVRKDNVKEVSIMCGKILNNIFGMYEKGIIKYQRTTPQTRSGNA